MSIEERTMHPFTCAECGVEDEVPFKPDGPVMCKECMWAEKEIRQRHAPRQQHGTRVMIEITCAECGKGETLDYMPRGKKLDEILCTGCAGEAFGKGSKWKRVRQQKKREERQSWRVSCDECDKPIYLNMKPDKDRLQLCNRCKFDHVPAGRDATRDAEPMAKGVLKRRGRRRVVSMVPEDSTPEPAAVESIEVPATESTPPVAVTPAASEEE